MTEHSTQENLSQTKISRNFKGIWIPREIWLHPTLSMQAKALWAEIDSLYDEEKGGCYASDEYLEQFIGLKRSRLHELYKELIEAGFLEKVSFDGRKSIRKAVIPENQTGRQVSGKPDSCLPENRIPEFRKTGHPTYIENKDKRKDTDTGVNPAPQSVSISKKSKKEKPQRHLISIPGCPLIEVTKEEHEKLLSKYGESFLKECYEHLNDWKESKSVADPKALAEHTDCGRITAWVNTAVKKKNTPQSSKITQLSQEQKVTKVDEIADRHDKISKYRTIHWELIKKNSIQFEVLSTFVRIGNDRIYFDAFNYKDLIINALIKVELPLQ